VVKEENTDSDGDGEYEVEKEDDTELSSVEDDQH
jgi:hypothetical protein